METQTIGDNTADVTTINSNTITTPNGLNFDTNTLVLNQIKQIV